MLLPTPFRPTKIAGLQLWLKADAITGVAAGGTVATWPDSSGNGNDATQATEANKPTWQTNVVNGHPVVRLDGTDDWLDVSDQAGFDGGTGLTIYAVSKQATLATGKALITKWDYQTQGAWGFQTHESTTGEIQMYVAETVTDVGDKIQRSTNAGLTATSFTIVVTVYDGTQATNADRVKFYRNGTVLSTAVQNTIPTSMPNASSTLKVGKFGGSLTRYYNGDLAELIVYSRALAAADRQRIERYLARKYGITLS